MEEQKIITIATPRITLKRTSVNKKIGWEIALSSSKDKEELEKMVLIIEEINNDMEKRFGRKQENKIKKEGGKQKK